MTFSQSLRNFSVLVASHRVPPYDTNIVSNTYTHRIVSTRKEYSDLGIYMYIFFQMDIWNRVI